MNKHCDLSIFGSYLARVERAITSIKRGNGVLLLDDEDRENEGDLIYSAQHLTTKQMALMIRECSGIVCLCLTNDHADQLELPPMVSHNNSANQTAFTISIEARTGVTTGVSAQDRVKTIKTATSPHCKPADLARPGHIFPLRARNGGVFERRGHTEGTVDLMQLAGLLPAGVLCEVTNADGTMANMSQIMSFGEKYNIPVLTVNDIIQYRHYIM